MIGSSLVRKSRLQRGLVAQQHRYVLHSSFLYHVSGEMNESAETVAHVFPGLVSEEGSFPLWILGSFPLHLGLLPSLKVREVMFDELLNNVTIVLRNLLVFVHEQIMKEALNVNHKQSSSSRSSSSSLSLSSLTSLVESDSVVMSEKSSFELSFLRRSLCTLCKYRTCSRA
ncbi:hypothetical protein ACHAWC_010119 [Mediolabrus comicus]